MVAFHAVSPRCALRFSPKSGEFRRWAAAQVPALQIEPTTLFCSGVVAARKTGWAIPLGLPCHNLLIALTISTGAGEEIRTLDPNLGKAHAKATQQALTEHPSAERFG